MLINTLFLSLLFILGLISTLFTFPRKKITAWFHSLRALTLNTATQTAIRTANSPNGVNMELAQKSCSENRVVDLKRVFATFDKNNDGYITRQELKESLKKIGILLTDNDVDEMVAKVDSNGDGLIDFDEFNELFKSMITSKEYAENDGEEEEGEEEEEGKERDLKEAFDVFDGDGDGLITVDELGLVLSSLGFNEGKTLESCKEMINKVDLDGDGMVNFHEFKRMMKADGTILVDVS